LVIRSKSQKIVLVDEKPTYDSLLKVYKDRNGKLYNELQVVKIDNANYKYQVDSLAKALKLKPKVIQGEDRYIIGTDTVFYEKSYPVLVYKDTAWQVQKVDNYVNILATAGRNTGTIVYSSVDTLVRVETTKTNLFGKTTEKVYIRNTNPYNSIKSGFSYSKVQKRAYLSLGPSVNYDPFMNRFSIGVSLQYPLIQLKK
jgi:hypothetical protein